MIDDNTSKDSEFVTSGKAIELASGGRPCAIIFIKLKE
jgi:hypothetical protein